MPSLLATAGGWNGPTAIPDVWAAFLTKSESKDAPSPNKKYRKFGRDREKDCFVESEQSFILA